MVLPYDNVENAAQHLQGCVVMYDDRPHYVREVYRQTNGKRDIMAILSAMPRMRDEIHVPIFDPLFDAKCLGQRLGYVNFGDTIGTLWLSRIPSRQYKQGLIRQNVLVTMGGGRRDPGVRFDTLLQHAGLSDCLRGIYPTFDQAIQKLDDNPNLPSVAFHKHFALERQDLGYHLLCYRNERVAWGDPKKFKLPEHFIYLKETLDKLGVTYEA